MKRIYSFLIIACVSTLFFACDKKADTPQTTYDATGNWWGKFGTTSSNMVNEWGFMLKSDGTMVVNTGTQTSLSEWGKGTYTMTNDSIHATITQSINNLKFSGGLSKDSKILNGFYTLNGAVIGYFAMAKQ